MSNPFFDHPILNSPYSCPRQHWELDAQGQPTQKIIERRRRAEFITPIPKPKKRKGSGDQTELFTDDPEGFSDAGQRYDTNSIINELRQHVEHWRAHGPSRPCSTPYNPAGSTIYMNFNSSKTLRWETDAQRCHINWVFLDSNWEAEFYRVAESHPRVLSYEKTTTSASRCPTATAQKCVGAVQVSVFADRIEVWNPDELPASMTTESLHHPHGSIARNHGLCEVLFLARYIEKYGTGTLIMIRESLAHNLPEPVFAQRGGEVTITLWRDWLTSDIMDYLNLNDRQRQAVLVVKTGEELNNKDYQEKFRVSKPTASRDLDELVRKGVLEKVGTTGKGTYYVLSRKGLIKGSKGSS